MYLSTRVPTALFPPFPIIRSPLQCPGTLRSFTSGGRSLIMTILEIGPDFLVCPLGIRFVLPERKQRASSLRSSPLPWTNSGINHKTGH